MYGVGVTNRYALFLAEEDPLEQLKAKEKAREEKKKKLPLVGAEKENKGVKTPPVKNKPALKVTDGIKDNQNVVKTETQPKKGKNRRGSAVVFPRDMGYHFFLA